MTINVEPLRSDERPICAYCGKPLPFRRVEYQDVPADEAEAFLSNRRIVRAVRKVDYRGRAIVRLTFQPSSYGYRGDGLFCTATCAVKLARQVARERKREAGR
jgi:hypothetical protein